MNITIIGTGYVGLVTGVCLGDLGNNVFCLDVDQAKIELLNSGGMHSYEPGLKEVIARNVEAGRLTFLTEVAASVAHGSVQFIAVGTPLDEDGSADLQYVLAAVRNIGCHMTDFKVVLDKSTVPVGTADKVSATIQAELAARFSLPAPSSLPFPLGEGGGEGLAGSPFPASPAFALVSNPEFLKEGAAVEDFTRPDRIVLGVADDVSGQQALATRISFMNELANLADQVGTDIELVRQGIGSDPRIGYSFLYAGIGYGGSWFSQRRASHSPHRARAWPNPARARSGGGRKQRPKTCASQQGVYQIWTQLERQNFRPVGSDLQTQYQQMREAPSRVVIIALLRAGARIVAHDPVAEQEARRGLAQDLAEAPALLENLQFADKPMEAVQNADALIILTEWKAYRSPNSALKAAIKTPVIFDGRNLYEPHMLQEADIEYIGIGR